MEAGTLRERVAFDKRTTIPNDGAGNTVGPWAEQFTCAAAIVFMKGGEPVMAARLAGVQPVAVTVRRFAQTVTADTAWRIRDARSGAVFNIRSVTPSADRKWIEFTCEVGSDDG